ncbi:hypothetical protein EYR38_004988 [Pleurotus pulmonarius]|nr:hypothetical protein EYR38_004988 [Pleurotus pulmonarius]
MSSTFMDLSREQQQALYRAQEILRSAGLPAYQHPDLTQPEPANTLATLTAPGLDLSDVAGPLPSSTGLPILQYCAPLARQFTTAEIAQGLHRLNRQTELTGIVEHPHYAIVEYPQTGAHPGQAIAHRFTVHPQDGTHPKGDFQYSLGNSHGSHPNVRCKLLVNDDGKPVICTHLRTSCRGLKYCDAGVASTVAHHYVPSRQAIVRDQHCRGGLDNGVHFGAEEEVFTKTLAFYCALVEKGCDVHVERPPSDDSGSDFADNAPSISTTSRQPKRRAGCTGRLVIKRNTFNRPYIQCELRSQHDLAHIIVNDLNEYDIDYLTALLTATSQEVSKFELDARSKGYGPLAPCKFVASRGEQKQLCPFWHRTKDGLLQRGVLKNLPDPCPATFDIYTPDDLTTCPQVLIVCRNPHSHSPPLPIKTPESVMGIFHALLLGLGWKLADATPRKIILDSGFMDSLRRAINWNQQLDPTLADLHPSLANLDRVRRCITALRDEFFPSGTGFKGAKLILHQHSALHLHEQYVRAVELHPLEHDKALHLVICMTPAMSRHLTQSKRLTIDTSFKRLHGYQEFEIETWDVFGMRSIVSCRAFITSQSAEAHLLLFKRIFEIAKVDTGEDIKFRHIHGSGIEVWVADAHKGQALGLGMFCQHLCHDLDMPCQDEPMRRLSDLNPYDHLKRCFKICSVHFKRHIHDLRPHISDDVRFAMLSLASSDPHPDLEGAFRTIQNGGPKAVAWLKDKREGSKFALPALYHPLSYIPLDIWKSAPSSTNGNEQAHRNINRDGVNLTLLGGIMRGMQYDNRAMATLDLYSSVGIFPRDQTTTHYRRVASSIYRKVYVQQRAAVKREQLGDEVMPPPSHNTLASAPLALSLHALPKRTMPSPSPPSPLAPHQPLNHLAQTEPGGAGSLTVIPRSLFTTRPLTSVLSERRH